MEGRRRMTLYDQMSAFDGRRDSLAGSTLEAVMASHKIASEQSRRRQFSSSRTLSDIIREDNSNTKDKKSWKIFKDKLWLKCAGSAWFSTINVPALDISISNRNNSSSDAPSTSNPPELSGQILTSAQSSLHAAFSGESTHQTSGPNSFRRDGSVTFRDRLDSDGSECDDWDPAREGTRRLSTILSEERALSAREAESAAAAAAASSSALAAQGEYEPVRMSLTLMDLLEETDRQMGFDASQYRTTGDEDEDEEVRKRIKREEVEDEEAEEEEEESKRWSIQENCCVCMVRHKGAAFIPCGHTFCRQCSRELWVNRGHCPLCNNVILEILDLF